MKTQIKQNLKGLAEIAAVGIIAVAGVFGLTKALRCYDSNFPAKQGLPTAGLLEVFQVSDWEHGGVKEFREDIDFDLDRQPDPYVICKDGTVFYTRSSRLLTGQDNSEQRTWYKESPDDFKLRLKGETK